MCNFIPFQNAIIGGPVDCTENNYLTVCGVIRLIPLFVTLANMRTYKLVFSLFFVQMFIVQAHAQVQIGGGTCTNATLKGIFGAISTGRQINSSGVFVKVFQGVGTITFDGQGKATFALNTSTNGAATQQQSYSGTYSLAADCSGTLTASVSSGVTALYSLSVWNQGQNFQMSGSDGTYTLLANGTLQSISPCSASSLNGNYIIQINGDQFTAGGAVAGVIAATSVFQFDGQGKLTGSVFQVVGVAPSTVTVTGTYTVSSDCSGTLSYTDSANRASTVSLEVNGPDVVFAGLSSGVAYTGAGHAAFVSAGQATTTGTCDLTTLGGSYGVSVTGRQVSAAGVLAQVFQGEGTASFDGQGGVNLALTASKNGAPAAQAVFPGTYTLGASCAGTMTLQIQGGQTSVFGIGAYNNGRNLLVSGADHTFALNGNGGPQASACLLSSLSGDYAYQANGWPFSAAGSVTGATDFSGTFQFDGQGNLTGNSSQVVNGALTSVTQKGTYSIGPTCLGTATYTDSLGKAYTVSLSGTVNGADFQFIGQGNQVSVSGGGHVVFSATSQAMTNGASFAKGSAAPGSFFSIFGVNLASKPDSAGAIPLPPTLGTTSVTVNGEAAPLFFVSPGQINAQVPWDIQPGLATVVVKNGASASNAAALNVPAAAPGLVFYGDNRAVVQNQDYSLNTQSSPAKVGDVLMAYFTGGGLAQTNVATGAANPNAAVFLAQTSYSVAVAGKPAKVTYMGLAPLFVGLNQANFEVPQVAAGDRLMVITIAGVSSNAAFIAIK